MRIIFSSFFGLIYAVSCFAQSEVVSHKSGVHIYYADAKNVYQDAKKEGVEKLRKIILYIPKGDQTKSPLPLVVSSHGFSGNAQKEMLALKPLAIQHSFIALTMDFKGATGSGRSLAEAIQIVKEDGKVLLFFLEKMKKSLSWDRKKTLFTGFSGGGMPLWHIGLAHPETFSALCGRSANFFGSEGLSVRRPENRPIFIFWGIKDDYRILVSGYTGKGEGPSQVNFLSDFCDNLEFRLFLGGHVSRIDKAVEWFMKLKP